LTTLRQRESGEYTAPPLVPLENAESLQRLEAGLAFGGLVGRAVLYLVLFLWAAGSPTGAAVLQGLVIADVLTWAVMSVFDWQFRGLQVTVGGISQFVLVLIYLNRESLFEISTDAESMGITMLSFLLFAIVKSALWGGDRLLEATGIKEPG
jgi:hypothetical protein